MQAYALGIILLFFSPVQELCLSLALQSDLDCFTNVLVLEAAYDSDG